MNHRTCFLGGFVLGLFLMSIHAAAGAPLMIDLTRDLAKPSSVDLGQATPADPAGHTLTADSCSLLLDGKPWIPVAGEFHYARYPRAEWRDELLKMKAGGISVVTTYVFWNHQEEQKGLFDWSDRRSLRGFLQLCKELDLKAIVRMGPWAHGEARNGGFPDWVQNSGVKLRTDDPAFMQMVEPLYQQIAEQMKGLLWKDGGPVIGIQVDNECNNLRYLLALKKLAIACGVEVPIYTMTGWNGVRIPDKDLLPLFGSYADGFWGASLESYRTGFVFTDIRDTGDLGAQFSNKHPDRSNNIRLFPYLCCEIGGGMASSYKRRVAIEPEVTADLAMVKLGCGNNMPGYYMFHGGINPDAKSGYLNETHPNAMPLKDYDFVAPLGACGEVREQFYLLHEQHLFLEDFGEKLARMPANFPEVHPADLKDFSVLRWSVRSDGDSGFLFFSNRQPVVALPDHEGVQFGLKIRSGVQLVPRESVTIPSGSFGIWPVNVDCDGVGLEYATAQMLCRMTEGKTTYYFLAAIDGIDPEIALKPGAGQSVWGLDGSMRARHITAGLNEAVHVTKADGSGVAFVVLNPEQAMRLWRAPLQGHERLIVSDDTVLGDGGGLRILKEGATSSYAIFPPLKKVQVAGDSVEGKADGLFTRIELQSSFEPLTMGMELLNPAKPNAANLDATPEASWENAVEWKLTPPPSAEGKRVTLKINYIGDAARIYSDKGLVDDNYFNGEPFDLGLWRVAPEDWKSLRVKVMPMSEAVLKRLPEAVRLRCSTPAERAEWNDVTVTALEQREIRID